MEAVLDLPKTTFSQREEIPQVKADVVQRVILRGISWETYEKILADNEEASNPHFAYCDGELEIMVLGYQHETLKVRLSELITEIARILEIDYEGAASTTFRQEKRKKVLRVTAVFILKTQMLFAPKKKLI
ncbi:MAG: hypothetical protein WKF71_05150 [Pyrinomonadaceae bacterium]